MSNIFIGIGGTFLVSAAVLQIIAIVKNISLMEKITKPVPAAMILLVFILLEKNYLPDSKFLILHGTISLFLSLAGSVLNIFKEKKRLRAPGNILFTLAVLESVLITSPSFRLYSFNAVIAVIVTALYAALIILGFFIFVRNRKRSFIFFYFLSMAAAAFFSYSALLTLAGDTKLYSAMLFLCSLSIFAAILVRTKQESNEENAEEIDEASGIGSKKLSIVYFALKTSAELLFAAGCVLMQAV